VIISLKYTRAPDNTGEKQLLARIAWHIRVQRKSNRQGDKKPYAPVSCILA
jgi:hypothetical protein